ncbi:N-acetylmuramoyl-L-alanine amidase [Lederbergia wuyishanensis]|uniref:N-acetylmuramoyl-L-alanine amidase n=1 Tax=Lederbergia wuyishanensis TaxID=1347903 RepID=A0ABU0D3F2_9BACI|nr:N-acetylmuramoyl-L-alanine amidase [Lederbergia wuyishanensis]MCJ8007935.1 N-acetylmuramoyl-L-alanine amidase [Lederbergia wuyishanensis]MDQ0342898.1 N-acetylmuramoyl-L-alanine amidase [Lederbergia wuyishanensis]
MQQIKKLALLSIVFLLFLGTVKNAYANGDYEVGASSLNVREEPTKHSKVIGTLPRGTAVDVLEIQYDWAKIKYNGKTGWIASYFLYKTTNSTNKIESLVSVVANGVHLRSGPGTNHPIIGYTKSGDTFSLIETKGDWKRIRLKNGKSAWIAGWLVSSQQESIKISNSAGDLRGKTIIIDAGHGGYDPGAIGIGGLLEKDINYQTSQMVKKKLVQAGANVIMTRVDDRYVGLQERVNISQGFPASVFISIHHNAHKNLGAKGINTFYYQPTDKNLAFAIQEQLNKQTPLNNNGVQIGDYYVLRNNHPQSILLELGFLTNANDLGTIQSYQFQEQVANSIVQGLQNYFH